MDSISASILLILAAAAAVPAAAPSACAPRALFGPWATCDVAADSRAVTGSASFDPVSNAFTLTARGGGEGGIEDSFRFVFREVSGDFEMTARLVGFTDPNVREIAAGLALRDGLSPGARSLIVHYASSTNPDQIPPEVIQTIARPNERSLPVFGSLGRFAPRAGLPVYLKLIRCGDQVSAYSSSDAKEWSWRDGTTLRDLPATVQAGLAMTFGLPQRADGAIFDQVSIEPLSLGYTTAWFGNSFAGGEASVPQNVGGIFVDPATGETFTDVLWDEGGAEAVVLDANGRFERRLVPTHGGGRFGGSAVAASDEYVYLGTESRPFPQPRHGGPEPTYPPSGRKWIEVRRFRRADGAPAPWRAGGGGGDGSVLVVNDLEERSSAFVTGLAVFRGSEDPGKARLYVSDPAAGAVRIYTDSGPEVALARTVPLPDPGPIAVDRRDGTIWVIERGDPATAIHLSAGGDRLPGAAIAGLGDPTAIAVDRAGRLFIADDAPEAQIVRIFEPGGAPGSPAAFGIPGGIGAGVKGEVAPLKLNGPVGVGVDDGGNLLVACDGRTARSIFEAGQPGTGTEIRRFSPPPEGRLLWERHGLEFLDAADADPATDGRDAFTKEAHYVLDESARGGESWAYRGMTLDRFGSPDDMRLHVQDSGHPAGVFVRRIAGRRFLFLTTQHAVYLGVYRFSPGSEIATMCGLFNRIPLPDRAWPLGRPEDPNRARWIWRDLDGDGRIEAAEYEPLGLAQQGFGWYVDEEGSIWETSQSGNPPGAPTIRRIPASGLDDHGCPVYRAASEEAYMKPAEFTEATRAYYASSTDTMFLGGFTQERPRPEGGTEWGMVGTEIRRYDGWRRCASREANTCVARWRIADLPYDAPADDPHWHFHSVSSMSVAGDLVFAAVQETLEVRAYDACSGGLLRRMTPGPEVAGMHGWIDLPVGINAFRRADGEYLVFAEDDRQARQIVFRFRSPGACAP